MDKQQLMNTEHLVFTKYDCFHVKASYWCKAEVFLNHGSLESLLVIQWQLKTRAVWNPSKCSPALLDTLVLNNLSRITSHKHNSQSAVSKWLNVTVISPKVNDLYMVLVYEHAKSIQ